MELGKPNDFPEWGIQAARSEKESVGRGIGKEAKAMAVMVMDRGSSFAPI